MNSIDLSIVIPCFNEGENVMQLEHTLFPVVAQLAQQRTVEVIIVDDGSTDDTATHLFALAEKYPVLRLAHHRHNCGIGRALKTGFALARGEWIVTTDADATYRFEELPALLERCDPQVDIVTASPYHPAGGVDNVPAYRLALSRSASSLYRIILHGHIHTYTALFRAYRKEVVQTVPVRFDGFLAVAQLLTEASLQGYRIAEYPTVLHVRVYGQSKARVVRLTWAHLRYMASLIGQRLTQGSARTRLSGGRS